MTKFIDVTKTAFAFLLDHGLQVAAEETQPTVFGNGFVEFRSADVGVLVTLERGQVLVNIGPVNAPSSGWFGLPTLLAFYAPELAAPAYRFPEAWAEYDEMVAQQVTRVADLVGRYCLGVLSASAEVWNDLEYLRTRSAERKYRALTGKPLPKGAP